MSFADPGDCVLLIQSLAALPVLQAVLAPPVMTVVAGVVLDFFIGDPVFRLHPVRLLGDLAALCERVLHPVPKNAPEIPDGETRGSSPSDPGKSGLAARDAGVSSPGNSSPARLSPGVASPDSPDSATADTDARIFFPRPDPGPTGLFLSGFAAWLVVVGLASLLAWLLPRLASGVHPVAGFMLDVFFVWASIAPRDLARHAGAVYNRLRAGDLAGGRKAVSMIVGRDTDTLDEPGIVRACVESVAESSVDGALAPLFWALVLGPWAAFSYRAINTLDSMFGHRTLRYNYFGRVSARADDAANLIPARLSGFLAPLVCLLTGLDAAGAFRIFTRDRLKHESPNAGHPESAFAGALGLELGGPAVYSGEKIEHPVIGEAKRLAGPGSIREAVRLMYGIVMLMLTAFIMLRTAIQALT